MTTTQKLGFIGLGAMGTPMAKQTLQKHGALTICDVDHAAGAYLDVLTEVMPQTSADAGFGDLDWGAVILNDNPELRRD
jgi:3-hydroxyisobutyrate dehydrogenase-like beta-hydroxyacid dehydrogenase